MSMLNHLIKHIYSQAKSGNWDSVMSEWAEEPLLGRLCSGYQAPSSGWTFLHQGAYFGRKTACMELIRLGGSAAKLSNDGKTPVDVARERGFGELETLLHRSILEERSLWSPPSNPALLPSSHLFEDANEHRANSLLLVAYAEGIVQIPNSARYYADSFGRPLIGWHGTFDPPCGMDDQSMLRT